MDEDRLFNSIDCLGAPYDVDTSKITHTDIPVTQADLDAICCGSSGSITPKITCKILTKDRFDYWVVPSTESHSYLPPQPGWPGLMLRLDGDLEQWRPEEGRKYQVVIKCEAQSLKYVGQYEMIRLDDVPGDEWKEQSTEVFMAVRTGSVPITSNGVSKVKSKWTQVLGDGGLWQDILARVAMRKMLGREPSAEDLMKVVVKAYAGLCEDLKGDVDRALCGGEEVRLVCFS